MSLISPIHYWRICLRARKKDKRRQDKKKKIFKRPLVVLYQVFPSVSDSKESACNGGKLGSIPGSGRFIWRKKWQPAPVFLPGESHGQRSLVGYSPWGRMELDTTEAMDLTPFSKLFSRLLLWLFWKKGKRTNFLSLLYCLKDMLSSGSLTPVFRFSIQGLVHLYSGWKKTKYNQPPPSGRQWWFSERRSKMSLPALQQQHITMIPMAPEPTQTQELREVIS